MDLSHELSRDAHILTRNFSSAKSMRGARNTHQDDSTCCDAVSFPVVQRRTWRNWKVCACRRWCEGFAPQTASARVPISRSVPLHHRRRCAVEFIMMTQWYLINYASMKPYSCMQNWSNHASPSKGSINGGSHEEIWSLSASMKPYSLRQKWSNHASPSKGSINVGAHEIMRHLHPLFGGVGMPHFLFDPVQVSPFQSLETVGRSPKWVDNQVLKLSADLRPVKKSQPIGSL